MSNVYARMQLLPDRLQIIQESLHEGITVSRGENGSQERGEEEKILKTEKKEESAWSISER